MHLSIVFTVCEHEYININPTHIDPLRPLDKSNNINQVVLSC